MEDTFILNLETSALACSVALSKNSQLLYSAKSSGDWKHSKEITLLIIDCMKNAQMSYNQLSAVSISGGPGSYTGLRVAASCAKGICYANEIPLISVDTLKIIAQPLLNQVNDNEYVIPMIDARRDEVYYNIYDNLGNPIQETTNLILTENELIQYPNAIICGDAADKAQNLLKNPHLRYVSSFAEAENMINLSFLKFQSQSFEDLAYFSPFYLKPPNITKSKKTLI